MGKKGTAAQMAKTKKIMAQYGLTQAPEQHNPAHRTRIEPDRLPVERGGILPPSRLPVERGGILPTTPLEPPPKRRRRQPDRTTQRGQLTGGPVLFTQTSGRRRPPDAPQTTNPFAKKRPPPAPVIGLFPDFSTQPRNPRTLEQILARRKPGRRVGRNLSPGTPRRIGRFRAGFFPSSNPNPLPRRGRRKKKR